MGTCICIGSVLKIAYGRRLVRRRRRRTLYVCDTSDQSVRE